MKKCRTLLSVCTAFAFVVLMLSACSSSEEVNPIEPAVAGTKSVSLKVTQSAVTRAIGESAAVGSGAQVTVTSGGHLLFVDNGGLVTHYVEVTVGSLNSGGSDPRVAFEDLKTENGAEITNVPAESVEVYLILNLPASGIASAPSGGWIGTTLSAVDDVLITAEQLHDVNGGVANVPISGGAELTDDPDGVFELEAVVDLAPIASRFEIKKIALDVDDLTTRGLAVDATFAIAGIYINNYYPRVSVTGNYPFVTLNAGQDVDKYDQDNTTDFLWKAANYGTYLYTLNAGS
ncbi:MAG: hypothetical protein LBQ39_02680, partial [Tannerellaceae bacterium]|nr:hypothetical protein [Tannerellaceae bacterium]